MISEPPIYIGKVVHQHIHDLEACNPKLYFLIKLYEISNNKNSFTDFKNITAIKITIILVTNIYIVSNPYLIVLISTSLHSLCLIIRFVK